MGSDLRTHLGPYIEVLGDLQTNETIEKRQCPKHRTLKQDQNQFCGTCGTRIEIFEIPITKKG
jgi:hypothetical protein